MSVCGVGLCGIAGPGGVIAQGVAGSIGKAAAAKTASAVLTAFATWVVGGATWLVTHVVGLLAPGTGIDLPAGWFDQEERSMLGIAALMVGPLLAAATIGAVVRQDGRRLLRVFAVGLPVGVLSAAMAVALTRWALSAVDEMCTLITSGDRYHSFEALGASIAQPGIPMFVQFVMGAFVVLAAVALWMELVLRAAVVYIAVFFLPLGLAAFVWPATAHITKRFVEILVAVIGSKFVIVATLTLGEGFIGHHGTGGVGIDDTVTGAVVLLLAAFAPFAVLRLVPVVEASATAHLEGLSRRPGRAAVSGASSALTSGARWAGVLGGAREGGLVAGGVGALDIGERMGEWSLGPAGGGDAAPDGPPGSGGAIGTVGASWSGGTARSGAPSGSGVPSGPGGPPGPGGEARPGGWGEGSRQPGARTSTLERPEVITPPAPPAARAGPAGAGGADLEAPSVPALPPVVPGHITPDLDGWSDDA